MKNKPLCYDVCCGAGGATKGYQDAGFYVIGIDHKPQPNYIGDEFVQMDALKFLAQLASGLWEAPLFVHISPPCQGYSNLAALPNVDADSYQKMIKGVRDLVKSMPYVIENVTGARSEMEAPIMLCGLMFGLLTFRHRYFEIRPMILSPGHPKHPKWATTKASRSYSSFKNGATHISLAGNNYSRKDGIVAMGGCEWMTRDELSEAIPPAYTDFIGQQLLRHLTPRETDLLRSEPAGAKNQLSMFAGDGSE